jgi:hypothetical protein
MNWVITDKSNLEGTAYIEVYPAKFDSTHWNDTSIFFEEWHFEYFVPIIRRHYPAYDPYGFQSINQDIWGKILFDLNELKKKIEAGVKTNEIRQDISFLSEYTENEFLENERESLQSLLETTKYFISWLEKHLAETNIISILGL